MANCPGSKLKLKKSANITVDQETALINQEIMLKLSLMRQDVVNLQDELEGLHSVLEVKDQEAATRDQAISSLEHEIELINQRDYLPFTPHWHKLKGKLQKLRQINQILASIIESNYAA